MPKFRQFTVPPEDDGIRLDRWFKRNLPDARFNRLALGAHGQLRLDGKRATPGRPRRSRPDHPRSSGETGREDVPARSPQRPQLSEDEIAYVGEMVIHSDPAAFVVNKPPGPRHPGRHQDKRHLDGCSTACRARRRTGPKLVHRLDKDSPVPADRAPHSPRAPLSSRRLLGAHGAQGLLGAGDRRARRPRRQSSRLRSASSSAPAGGEGCALTRNQGPARAHPLSEVVERSRATAPPGSSSSRFTGRPTSCASHGGDRHPIVGDGQIWWARGVLTGSISRKLHLHARLACRIDPSGRGQVDVSPSCRAFAAAGHASASSSRQADQSRSTRVEISETLRRQAQGPTAAASAAQGSEGSGGAGQREQASPRIFDCDARW
jgi:23S rRNA pseudouridine955/2504/2580 synthase